MSQLFAFALATLLGLLAAAESRAEVTTVWERNEGPAATAEFKFPHIPAPSKTDAAVSARFTILVGQSDPNGGDVDVLGDGLVPTDDDQPEANFFFAAGTDGGRVLVDLGAVTEVKQVCTYSWHRGTRGPQVYRLYASDGSAQDFAAQPTRLTDLGQAGWKLVTSVDTRPKTGPLGGQYGVCISDSGSAALGHIRYLLFEVSRTADQDHFGNTFFSEIDVSDGREHAAPPAAPAQYEIVFDTAETPELTDWVKSRLRPVCEQWYPKIIELLACDGYRPPRRFTVTFRKDMQGVASTSGKQIACAGRWFQQNLEGEAIGAVVHELVHVVQQYGRARGVDRNPGWLVEGVADYIRWFQFEPPALRPHPNPARAKYTDSYRTTAAFLNYVVEQHDKQLVPQFHAALRANTYTPELWKTYTGKTVDELWEEYLQTL
ncbi:MAG: basic secretory protein-like protein [Planctomycetota bacterium]|nr:basic secretory protein-like protein [Planctomycetota bacterium]